MAGKDSPIAMLGAGAFGTALAIHLAKNGNEVQLWDRDTEKLNRMRQRREHPLFAATNIPEKVAIEIALNKALANTNDIIIAVSSAGFKDVLEHIKLFLKPTTRIAWITKGFEPKTSRLLQELVQDVCGDIPMAVISGPSFAKEIVKGLPTAVVVASNDSNFTTDLTERFNSPSFRVYSNDDMVGVQLGGAVKNVYAISTGMSDGMGFGANARSALITRGIAEMQQLYEAMGAKTSTLMGLAGVGDLVLTCTDDQSRNRRLGLMMGQGKTLADAKAEIAQSIEGINTAIELHQLAEKYNLFMPISDQVYHLVTEKIKPREAAQKLLAREAKAEF